MSTKSEGDYVLHTSGELIRLRIATARQVDKNKELSGQIRFAICWEKGVNSAATNRLIEWFYN